MKLNNSEIKALANKVYTDIKKKIKEQNNTIEVENSYDKWLIKFKKTSEYKLVLNLENSYKQLNINFPEWELRVHYNRSLEEFIKSKLEEIYNKTISRREVPIKEEQLINEIIIAQITTSDIDLMITNLVEKYTK